MLRAPLIMGAVAFTSGVAALVVFTRPGASEQAVYGRRIAGTMFAALAIILGGFAYALGSWGSGS
jgi:uncharacterized membrane protein YedE/YeeE